MSCVICISVRALNESMLARQISDTGDVAVSNAILKVDEKAMCEH